MGGNLGAAAPGRRLRIARPGTALALGVLIVITMAVSATANAFGGALRLSSLGEAALWLSFGLVGGVVAWHQPRNPMGWVLLGITFFFAVDGAASGYAILDYRYRGGRLPLGWLAVLLSPSWAPAIVLAGLALLLFPDGRFPPGRWRPVTWAYLALGAVWLIGAFAISLGAVLGRHVSIDSTGGLTSLDDPRGSSAWFGVVQAVFFPAVAACWLAWLRVVDGLAAIGTLALPVSIGFGILKFRLYDIDRIISRTLAYTIVTGVLAGLYAGIVLLATQVLHHPGPVTVAVSTLAAPTCSTWSARRWSRRTCQCGRLPPDVAARRVAIPAPPGSARRRWPPACRPGW